jgi:hypothetical protein
MAWLGKEFSGLILAGVGIRHHIIYQGGEAVMGISLTCFGGHFKLMFFFVCIYLGLQTIYRPVIIYR